jgi:hypothetical protein
MASKSICPHCQHSGFEMATESPKQSNWKYSFIRCSSCGTVVGVTEFFNIGTLIHKMAKKLDVDLEG